MQIFEAASISVDETPLILIRVPDHVLRDMELTGTVMARAEREFRHDVVLLGADSGQPFGSHHHKRLLHDFDPQKAKWSQWNMVG